MKNSILALGITLFALNLVPAQASDLSELECDSMIGYRPGGSTLMEAGGSFHTELEILLNSCKVQQMVAAKGEGNFYVLSYSKSTEEGQSLLFELIQFADKTRPTSSKCTLTAKEVRVPSTPSQGPSLMMGEFKTEYALNCSEPKCTASQSPLCRETK